MLYLWDIFVHFYSKILEILLKNIKFIQFVSHCDVAMGWDEDGFLNIGIYVYSFFYSF